MKIMGVDPGTARVGWAIIQKTHNHIASISYGCLTTDMRSDQADRLNEIYRKLSLLIRKYKPECLVVEDLFFATNAKTLIPVAQARGVILLAAAQARTPVISYSPPAVKRTITGNGNADKKQIQYMVRLTLKLRKVPKPDDTADALAIAMTHAYSNKPMRPI